MSTAVESAAQQRFRDTRNKLAVILNDLADVAQVRGEIVLNGEAAEERRALRKQPLADVLRKKAEVVAARTPFRVAVVGEFSRGKSTLINALLGREILATDFRPNTAARTVLKYGEPERFRVRYVKELGGRALVRESKNLGRDLDEFISDAAVNADYGVLLRGDKKSLAKQIQEVEVWCVSDFLKTKEMEIIDTPGLGSVFPVHRAVTYEVIPFVDATLFVVQADPGPGESEILFLKYVREHVDQIFFVLTKADMARSQDELEGMLEFVRKTIEAQADLQVENLYPVSALLAIEGREEKSGFPEFLPALEGFLVRSSGVARLQAPQHLARTHWARLSNAVERDIQALDRDLNDLRAELGRLLKEKKKIQRARAKLLGDVDHRIEELVDLATDGMEGHLPLRIQREVEVAVDELSVKELLKASDHLQLVMKDTVIGWLDKKKDRFRASTEQLQHRIEEDLQGILDTIETSEAPVDYGVSVDVATPQVRAGWWSEMGRLFGVPVLTGAAGILAAVLGITMIPTTIVVVASLIGLGAPVLGFKETARNRIKEALLKPVPGNDVNVYQAIVAGFEQDGQRSSGVQGVVEEAFWEWGAQLKRVISETVTNNLDGRLSQLQRQIKEKESGQQNRGQDLGGYTRQKEKLCDLGSRLDKVARIIMELSDGQIEGESRLVEGTEAEDKREQGSQKAASPKAKSKSKPASQKADKPRAKKK